MNNKLQHFDPNIVEELRTVHEDRPDYSFSDDEIDKLFIAIDYWRRGLQDEHLLVITLTQSMKLLLEEVNKLKSEINKARDDLTKANEDCAEYRRDSTQL